MNLSEIIFIIIKIVKITNKKYTIIIFFLIDNILVTKSNN